MAFPDVVTGHGRSGFTTAVSTYAIDVVDTPAVGDRLFYVFRNTAGATPMTWPGHWTELTDVLHDCTSDDRVSMAYVDLEAGDPELTNATFNVTGGSGKGAALGWRILAGTFDPATPPEISTIGLGTSDSPDAPSFDPSWGTEDTLWGYMISCEGEQTVPIAATPTNYTMEKDSIGSGAAGAIDTNCRVAGIWRESAAASEDPGIWLISASDEWTAWTVAIRPVVAAAGEALAADPAGIATVTAALTETAQLAGAPAGVASVVATLGGLQNLAASVVSTATVDAALRGTDPVEHLAADVVGGGAVAAALGGKTGIAADVLGSSELVAVLSGVEVPPPSEGQDSYGPGPKARGIGRFQRPKVDVP